MGLRFWNTAGMSSMRLTNQKNSEKILEILQKLLLF